MDIDACQCVPFFSLCPSTGFGTFEYYITLVDCVVVKL